MAQIRTLKDNDKNIVYPQSVTQAIVDANGDSLDAILHNVVMTASEEDVEDVVINYEEVGNKVTIVDDTSTDLTYPSSKAVYDAILANKSVDIDLSEYAKMTDIPTTTSQLTNDSDFITGTELSNQNYVTQTYVDNKITYGTVTLEDGVSELTTGTLYVVYEE